jgi:hypothetical protein
METGESGLGNEFACPPEGPGFDEDIVGSFG